MFHIRVDLLVIVFRLVFRFERPFSFRCESRLCSNNLNSEQAPPPQVKLSFDFFRLIKIKDVHSFVHYDCVKRL